MIPDAGVVLCPAGPETFRMDLTARNLRIQAFASMRICGHARIYVRGVRPRVIPISRPLFGSGAQVTIGPDAGAWTN